MRVLEIGADPALAFCGMQLARWGAEVAVLESFTGDLRQRSPCIGDDSLTWKYLTLNKTLLSTVSRDVSTTADVILTTLKKDELIEQGIEIGDDSIFHRIAPFSSGGYYQDLTGISLLLEAASGFLTINGEAAREPVRMPCNIVSYMTGSHACLATLAAYFKLLRTGEVEAIETSQLDALTTVVPFVRSQFADAPEGRHGGPATGVRLYPIGKGKISANLADPLNFASVCAELGLEQEDVPEVLRETEGRANQQALIAFLKEQSSEADAEAVFEGAMARGVQRFGLFLNPTQLFSNRQLASLGCFDEIEDDVHQGLQYPGLPARIEGYSPPTLALAKRSNGFSWGDASTHRSLSKQGLRPLEGLRVIDFTQAWIGPYATMLLADLGADVIKVESHHRVDVWRNWRGALPAPGRLNKDAHRFNISPNFNCTNRNKREIAIDLKHAEGLSIVKDLIATADVVASNFTPRVMQKFGLDFESLKAVKQDIVNVSWSGYGDMGPYRDYKANGATVEALSGWDALFGYHDGEPMVMGFYQMDPFCGLHMVIATLVALIRRDRTGEAQNVNGSMIETALGYIGEEVLLGSAGDIATRWGNRHPDFVPHGVFATRDQDQWVALCCQDDETWRNLSQIIDCKEPHWASLTSRLEDVDQVERKVEAWTRQFDKDEAAARLRDAGVPAVAVVDSLEILEHPEFTQRAWFQKQFHLDIGEHWQSGFAWKFKHTTLRADYPPPRLGEHTEEILKSIGYSDDRIHKLFAQDTVGCVLFHADYDASQS
ncbi:MAG: CoA transferase [Gammaproteobacteria bacterium]|nr:CoA transferase [Gammaproteobacteria bacterium]